MADTTRTNPKATKPPRSADDQRTGRGETRTTPQMDMAHESRLQAALIDPQAAEFPTGSDNAGLKDYPEENAGSPETRWSTKNMVIGLGVAVIAIVVLMMVF